MPRIYANELTKESPDYLNYFGKYLQKNLGVFHCGTKIVAENINQKIINNLKPLIDHELVIWDNLYANDYCPRRIFISPWYNRNLKNIMINPTGMLQTDLLLIDIISNNQRNIDLKKSFLVTLNEHKIPEEFTEILHYFENPVLNTNNSINKILCLEEVKIIDHLLWKWKSKLALEWYPYLMGLKQDILMKNNKLSKKRILKTQTYPLSNKLLYI